MLRTSLIAIHSKYTHVYSKCPSEVIWEYLIGCLHFSQSPCRVESLAGPPPGLGGVRPVSRPSLAILVGEGGGGALAAGGGVGLGRLEVSMDLGDTGTGREATPGGAGG